MNGIYSEFLELTQRRAVDADRDGDLASATPVDRDLRPDVDAAARGDERDDEQGDAPDGHPQLLRRAVGGG